MNAISIPADSEYALEHGYEIVPTRRAVALVEYYDTLKSITLTGGANFRLMSDEQKSMNKEILA